MVVHSTQLAHTADAEETTADGWVVILLGISHMPHLDQSLYPDELADSSETRYNRPESRSFARYHARIRSVKRHPSRCLPTWAQSRSLRAY